MDIFLRPNKNRGFKILEVWVFIFKILVVSNADGTFRFYLLLNYFIRSYYMNISLLPVDCRVLVLLYILALLYTDDLLIYIYGS